MSRVLWWVTNGLRRGSSGDRLHCRRLDLDEPLLGHGLAERGDQFGSAGEDGHRVGVAEQVDVALPIALFQVGQAMPLLGRGEQALGQESERLGEDGQLTGPGVAKPAVDADHVTKVEEFRELPAQLSDLFLANEDLDVPRPIAQLEEDDFPLTAAQADPAGHADDRAGLAALGLVLLRCCRRADLPDGPVAVEPMAPGIEPQVRDPVELLQADLFQTLARLFGHHSP